MDEILSDAQQAYTKNRRDRRWMILYKTKSGWVILKETASFAEAKVAYIDKLTHPTANMSDAPLLVRVVDPWVVLYPVS